MTSSTICVNHKLKVLECHVSARGQLRSLMTQGDQRCERIVCPGWELIPAGGHLQTMTRGVKESDGSEINPHLGSREGSFKKNQNITLRIIAHFFGRRRSVQLSGDYCIGLLYIIEFTTP